MTKTQWLKDEEKTVSLSMENINIGKKIYKGRLLEAKEKGISLITENIRMSKSCTKSEANIVVVGPKFFKILWFRSNLRRF